MEESAKDEVLSDTTSEDKRENKDTISNVNITEEGKNEQTILCQRCSSKILKPHSATYVEAEQYLPFMERRSLISQVNEGETLYHYWCVDDIYTFENIGFSNSVGTVKYLACADCEVGPIGWHDCNNKKSYVSPKRVLHC